MDGCNSVSSQNCVFFIHLMMLRITPLLRLSSSLPPPSSSPLKAWHPKWGGRREGAHAPLSSFSGILERSNRSSSFSSSPFVASSFYSSQPSPHPNNFVSNLSLEEYKILMHRIGIKDDLLIERNFQAWDIDGDNHLNFQEFLSGLTTLYTNDTQAALHKLAYKIYDINGNKRLDKDEFTTILSRALSDLTEEQIASLVEDFFVEAKRGSTEEDDEGLTFEEFCKGAAVYKVVLDCLRPTMLIGDHAEKAKNILEQSVEPSEVSDAVLSKPLAFPREEMVEYLDHDNHETREKFRKLANDPIMIPRYQLTLEEERQLALDRLQKICDNQLISVRDFIDNPHRIFSAHEMTAYMCGATATKMTVQFNLFGGTVLKIGSEKHRQLLNKIDTLAQIGCFGLTELGYGNNAVEMETTATYDPASKTFVLNSPTTLSKKYWITNSAIHAKWCVVFSRLIVDGNDEGIHGLLVRIREQDHSVSYGVQIQDMGHKIGVNGVDNGILSFKNVRVPRDNLLDSVASVSPSGEFSSPIERKRDRFLTLADQLLSGRLCIASMCLGASKYGLRTAVKYALSRKALGRDGKSSAKLMSFQLQQRAFMPLIAETYAHNIALNYAKDQFKLLQDAEGEEHQKLVVLCCVLKPMITWSTNEIANTVRERCGGQGYLSINRFGELWAGAHAGMTAEGDNSVLMQKVAKELLMMEKNKAEVAKYMIETSLPLSMQRMMARTSFGDLSDPQFQLRLFNLREKRAKMMLMSRLQLDRIQSHLPLYDSWCHQNQDHVQHFAKAHGERVILEQFIEATQREKEKDSSLYPMLNRLCRLYGLSHLEQDVAWFLHEGLLNRSATVGLSQVVRNVCAELSEYADELVDGFGVPSVDHEPPIQGDWAAYNEWDNNGEHPHN